MKQVLPQNRKVIFWRNDAANLTFSDSDILHYWGAQADVSRGIYLDIFSDCWIQQ